MKEKKNKPNELKRGDRGEQKSLKLKTERPELNKQKDAPIKRSIKFLSPQQCKETKELKLSIPGIKGQVSLQTPQASKR